MPEVIAAHITIGGCVARELVEELCELISREDLALEWSGKQFEPQSAEDLLSACRTAGKRLRLFADAASWGEFDLLEPFLIEHQVPFDRHHDSKYEIDRSTLFYRTELGRLEFLTDGSEAVLCPVQPLRAVSKMLAQVRLELKRGRSPEAGFLIEECVEELREHLPPEIPQLPAFEII